MILCDGCVLFAHCSAESRSKTCEYATVHRERSSLQTSAPSNDYARSQSSNHGIPCVWVMAGVTICRGSDAWGAIEAPSSSPVISPIHTERWRMPSGEHQAHASRRSRTASMHFLNLFATFPPCLHHCLGVTGFNDVLTSRPMQHKLVL